MEVISIANTGKRRICRCIEGMEIYVGKEKRDLFSKGKTYSCVIRETNQLQVSYKIYGEEFDLSCTEVEFQQHFVIANKKTGVKR